MNNLRNKICLMLLLTAFMACSKSESNNEIQELESIPEFIGVEQSAAKGLFCLKQQQLIPDSNGIIAEIKLQLPKFQNGVYYRPFSEKLAAGNRVEPLWFSQISDLPTMVQKSPRMDNSLNLGAFLMLQEDDGRYLALLPLVTNHIGNTFSIRDESVFLTMATYGTRTEDVSVPLISFARSENPYEAARMAWELAMNTEEINENINWRENKTYPEAFRYLGWCSWEHYKKDISEEIILDAIKGIKSSAIPFRWVLIDDGYLDAKKSQLMSFGVDPQKFPNGWDPIISQKDEKIKWMGIWRNFNGYWGGISPYHTMSHLQDHLEMRGERYMPKISAEASNAFYHEMTANTKDNGFDLIKVDFQSDNFRYNTGSENAILGVHYNNAALEENCVKQNLQLLNCIAMQNFNVFNHKYSALIRGSVDYKTTTYRLDVTLVQNFCNALWLGHTHWLDQDMFFANHKESARLMAVARAVSGGPVYLSDEANNIDDTVLKPVIYNDGRILGTLAPGVPLPESLMQDPFYGGKAFRMIAPLENKSAAILAVNLNQDEKPVKSAIRLSDYPFAGGMMQPYEGLWKLPEEGVLLYDQYAETAIVLTEEYAFDLESRKERLFLLSPIQFGWSVIGRPDKYLSAAGVKLLETDEKTLKIKMMEDGPLMIWSDGKVPASDNFEFTQLENGLWRGELKQATEHKEYIISTR
ncbi:Sip1-related alpha-galactosidase [Mangrovibacterium sp.]|uniref:Sip1-related alpha-galactosidase n=1 Tax=Mangrovibacterium sp. TaxID=1961364 RepID=UPI003562B7C5